ncbi:MAG TPA: AraC family transcriptional regulator [Planctomycetota bacterium]|nr:AraC family transcriptional regulator [Planctomycetota bacterium]
MPRPEPPLAFHTLHQSPLVTVRDYQCRHGRCGPGGEEASAKHSIVLLRRGAFTRHFGRRTVTTDANRVALFAAGSSYCVSHPGDGGDRGTTLQTTPRLLREIAGTLDATAADRAEPVTATEAPCTKAVFWRHRELVLRLESGEAVEPLWADVTVLQLLADALAGAFAVRGEAPRERPDTVADHRDRVEAARAWLAAHLTDKVTLDDVARATHSSPFHLARLFQRHTGMPVHRYLLQLRLRAALERLVGGNEDLTAVALEFGFASHSHFTDRFREAFGCPPSAVRRSSRRRLGQMRSKLEA